MSEHDDTMPVSADESCIACGSNSIDSVPYIAITYKSSSIFDNLKIRYCLHCGFGWSWPECDPVLLDNFYADHYRIPKKAVIDFQRLARPVVSSRRAIAQLLLARQFADVRSGEMMLEFGPGGGAGLDAACRVLDDPTLVAVELNTGAADGYHQLYGAQTYGDLEALTKSGARPKITLASHSVEHIRLGDLSEFLDRVFALMAPGGVFVAEVPHVDMRIHRETRTHDDPHLLFFSQESLKRVFLNSGFEVPFVDSCAALYETWWTSIQGEQDQSNLSILRRLFFRLPLSTQTWILRKYHAIRRDEFNFDSDEFSYGGNRTCLRVVAVKPN